MEKTKMTIVNVNTGEKRHGVPINAYKFWPVLPADKGTNTRGGGWMELVEDTIIPDGAKITEAINDKIAAAPVIAAPVKKKVDAGDAANDEVIVDPNGAPEEMVIEPVKVEPEIIKAEIKKPAAKRKPSPKRKR